MQIGPHLLRNNLIVAPMAGVTDRPFRQLCKSMGAGMAVSEMISSNVQLRDTAKSRRRADHEGEVDPISVQIAGADPAAMADAARYNADRGAQIIDINMGCPAKKVCNVAAGSALLQNEPLVGRILDAVVAAVSIPVTLKIRTGWNLHNRNAVRVAQIAQSSGVKALSVHGRTRACAFTGDVEYDTIAEVKSRIDIPVIANGDIDSPQKAREVLRRTGADALMIGRAAQGRPWIFREIEHYLTSGSELPPPQITEIRLVLVHHLHELYSLYGEQGGVRVARKHIGWYVRGLAGASQFRQTINRLETAQQQLAAVDAYLAGLATLGDRLTYIEELAA
jgi:tRNA-dihydrouridine synthase B